MKESSEPYMDNRKISNGVAALLITILAVHALLPGALADKVTIDDKFVNEQSITETVNILLTDNNRSELRFSLPTEAYSITVNGKAVQPINDSVTVLLNCTACSIKIGYNLDSVSQDDGNGYRSFSRTLNLPRSPQTLIYTVTLPKGYGVGSKLNDPSIVPVPESIDTNGENIIISWNDNTPELPKRYYVSYHDLETLDTFSSFKSELYEWPVYILMTMTLLIGFAAGYALKRKKPLMMEVPQSLLSPDEKSLIKILESMDGASQKEIVKKIGWSKSKVSAVMSNLEYKKIIEREKTGRNYKITLLKKMEK